MNPPTSVAEVNDLCARLVTLQQKIFGDRLIGSWLQGSFAFGEADENSDVDFVVAVQGELTQDDVKALQAAHKKLRHSGLPWSDHLEGSYFPVADLANPQRAGEPVWYLDHGADHLILSDHCNTLVVRQTLYQAGITLAGRSPLAVLDAVPADSLRRSMAEEMIEWGEEVLADPDRWATVFYQGFFVFSYCRVWHDWTHGVVSGKRTAMAWAREQLGTEWHGLLDRAWTTRIDPSATSRQPADPDDYVKSLELVRIVMERLSA